MFWGRVTTDTHAQIEMLPGQGATRANWEGGRKTSPQPGLGPTSMPVLTIPCEAPSQLSLLPSSSLSASPTSKIFSDCPHPPPRHTLNECFYLGPLLPSSSLKAVPGQGVGNLASCSSLSHSLAGNTDGLLFVRGWQVYPISMWKGPEKMHRSRMSTQTTLATSATNKSFLWSRGQ